VLLDCHKSYIRSYIASKVTGGKHTIKGISVLLLPAIESQKAPIHFKLDFIW